MDELDLYLALVRRQLRVGQRRAEAICTELRSHLEAQALQLEREGMNREQAVARAVARFGAPSEIAKRLVVSNSQCRREEFLKAMWLGLIAGAAVFYAWAVVLYLVHLQSINGITGWQSNVVIGGTVGALSGLATCVLRARLRAVARAAAWTGGALWITFMAVMCTLNGYPGFGRLLKDFALMGGILVLAFTTIALVAGHAVNRWVLGPGTVKPARAKPPR